MTDAVAGGRGRLLVTQALRDTRIRSVAFGYLFVVYAAVQPIGYRHAYPTAADRLAFARSFAGNAGLRLLYGQPHGVAGVAGYSAWRVGGVLAVAAAVFGLVVAVRALRAEEEAGRTEQLLAGPISRAGLLGAGGAMIAVSAALLWVAEFAGLAIGGLPLAGAGFLALATASVTLVCAAVGVLASQLAATRSGALGLGGCAVAAALVLRVLADTVAGAGWLRWATPLGWAEQLRPFSDPRPAVLLLPAITVAALGITGARLSARRDVGTGLLPSRDRAAPRLALLGSPAGQALRLQRGALTTWGVAVAVLLFVFGMISHSLSSADVPRSVQRQIDRLGAGSIVTPVGYLAFLFLFLAVALCLLAGSQVGALRRDEAAQLVTLLALPVSRRRWLAGRLLIAASTAVLLALLAGLAGWAGARATGVHLALPRLLEAGANTLPITALFLGVGVLAYALAPRIASSLTYGLVGAAFLWQLVGSLFTPPRWVLDLSPFAHLALVPSRPFQPVAAGALAGLGALAALVGVAVFGRRDLIVD